MDTEIDWTGCELVERIPGKVSGRPIVRGTRITPEGIVNSYDHGESIENIREGWPSLSVVRIKRLIEFAHAVKMLLDETLLGGHLKTGQRSGTRTR